MDRASDSQGGGRLNLVRWRPLESTGNIVGFHQEGAIVATWIQTLSEGLAPEVLLLLTKAAGLWSVGAQTM